MVCSLAMHKELQDWGPIIVLAAITGLGVPACRLKLWSLQQ